jgi:hypothetical protein
MSFKNMNLDWLTCIQEFGVPLQMIKQKLEILDAVFDVSNEVEDIARDPDNMFNDL